MMTIDTIIRYDIVTITLPPIQSWLPRMFVILDMHLIVICTFFNSVLSVRNKYIYMYIYLYVYAIVYQ